MSCATAESFDRWKSLLASIASKHKQLTTSGQLT